MCGRTAADQPALMQQMPIGAVFLRQLPCILGVLSARLLEIGVSAAVSVTLSLQNRVEAHSHVR